MYVPQDRQSSALPSTKGQGARIGRLPRWPITFTLTTWRGQAVGSRIHDGDFARGGDLVPRRTIFDFHTFMLCAYSSHSSHSSHSPHSAHSRHTRFVWAGPVGAAKRVGAVSAPRPRGVCGASVAGGSVPGGWWAATGPAIRLRLAPVARVGAYVTGPCAIGPDWALPLRSALWDLQMQIPNPESSACNELHVVIKLAQCRLGLLLSSLSSARGLFSASRPSLTASITAISESPAGPLLAPKVGGSSEGAFARGA